MNKFSQKARGVFTDWFGNGPWRASYAAADCIGWLFRRGLMLILVLTVLVLTLLTFGKFIGWNTTHANEEMKQGGKWVRHTMIEEKDHLKGFLPSATAWTVGMFMGFWRRYQVRVAKTVA